MEKPLLKWVGGKTQIINDVISLFPKTINNYHEIFLGGGSVLLAVLSNKDITVQNIYAYDINPALINVYTQIKDNPSQVYSAIKTIITKYLQLDIDGNVNRKPQNLEEASNSRESFYYWIRYKYNSLKNKNSAKSAAMFIFLNKTCFRGMCREGPNGFNVPYGHYKHKSVNNILDEQHLIRVHQLIQPVEFKCLDFRESLSQEFLDGDFVYLDPPYAPENKKSFVGYNKNGFTKEDHEALFQMSNQLPQFLMSNSRVTMVIESFPHCSIKEITCRRAINSKNPESTTQEVLIQKS